MMYDILEAEDRNNFHFPFSNSEILTHWTLMTSWENLSRGAGDVYILSSDKLAVALVMGIGHYEQRPG